jgi:RHS repeat-associated protein
MAYPTATTINDPDPYQSTVQYNFDTGAVTRRQDPKGAIQTISYDAAGRTDRITNQISGAYTRFVYGANYVQSFGSVNNVADESYFIQVFDGAGRPVSAANNHPGSTGGYTAHLLTYDVMGRLVASTNPTEINAGWVPVGDDAAGWVSTLQSYDWKGRPRTTTNPDGSTTDTSYSGCGCAGGEQTTVRDERGRRKRYTKDPLGRLATVEELDWGQSVYSTTTYTYNARDQITNINQAGQPRSFTYDGYGRLQTRTTPEQGTTSYSYFADDTTQTITDARGATTTFAYNNRGLPTSITYGVPTGVAATANVSFGYDAGGNRTSMTDGLGSVSYVYNTLSQMTSETRTFDGLGNYTLSYGYNLSGELNSVTNPWNAQVGYGYDQAGRPTNVSGANYGGVTSYVNSIAYRTFGPKQMSYSNGKALSLNYDNRMRVQDWTVAGVLGWQYSYTDLGENTGRAMFARNTASSTTGGQRDDTLDHSYDYDHLGRLIVSHTGYEARLHMSRQQPGDPTTFGPYSQAYGYDQQGNMNVRYGWGGWDAGYVNWTPSYTNNRLATNPATNAAMQYDASGNLTYDDYQSYSYDATGQQTYASATALSQNYDGDSLRVKKNDNGAILYYLRSTVLGGQVVAELYSNGSWARGYVYLGGQMVAIQDSGVNWVHQDPVTKSQRITNSSGTVISTIDVDPWGGETDKSSNQAFQPHRFTTYERDANAGDEAMMRRYTGKWHRFYQPDPSDGSYNLANPQSFNRYTYVQNDPVNLVDPSGLDWNFPDITQGGAPSGFWGWGNLIDPPRHPGRDIIAEDEKTWDIAIWSHRHPEETPGNRSSDFGLPQNPTYTNGQIKAAVGDCTKALFNVNMVDFQTSSRGSNGSFNGNNLNIANPANQGISIVNEVNAYSANQLARLHERIKGLQPGSVSRLAGLTIDFTTKSGQVTGFSPYRNFTARDVRNGSSTLAGVNAVVDTQIWELGNSLGDITGRHIAGTEKEEGPAFEDCVRKQLASP